MVIWQLHSVFWAFLCIIKPPNICPPHAISSVTRYYSVLHPPFLLFTYTIFFHSSICSITINSTADFFSAQPSVMLQFLCHKDVRWLSLTTTGVADHPFDGPAVFSSFSCPSSAYNTSHLGPHFFYLLKLFQSSVFQGMLVTASPSSVPSLFFLHIPLSLWEFLSIFPVSLISHLCCFPSKPEGVEKETTQNSVLCVKGKAHFLHTLYLFLCGLMGGMWRPSSKIFHVVWHFWVVKTHSIGRDFET